MGLQNKLKYVSYGGECVRRGALAASVGRSAAGGSLFAMYPSWQAAAVTHVNCDSYTTGCILGAKMATRPSSRRAPLKDFRGGDGGAETRRLVCRREKNRGRQTNGFIQVF